mmetsp:Transcript_17230/g.41887  ORF Transcript_17230/g.41887 Transcript_17230/m.41887 type:complete len:233 (+) Transcript_17230:1303-2001(+)
MKPSTTATALSRYSSSDANLDSIVYKLLNPMIANILDENTTKGFSVTPKTAGILSTANTTSLISTAIIHRSIGVAILIPSISVKNRSPSNLSVELMRLFENLTIWFSLKSSSSSSSLPRRTFPELAIKIAANTKRTALNFCIATAPAPIMTARMTIAPRIPQFKTLFWLSTGILKYSNSNKKTNKLSIDNDCSSRYPAKNSSDVSGPATRPNPVPKRIADSTQERVLLIAVS